MKGILYLLTISSLLIFSHTGVFGGNSMSLQNMPENAPVKKISMTAEKFKFTPDTITVKKGTRLILEITSIDSTHEFVLKAYDIDVKLPRKETVVVEIYADKPGEFEFGCHLGFGIHFRKGMKGKLIVTE